MRNRPKLTENEHGVGKRPEHRQQEPADEPGPYDLQQQLAAGREERRGHVHQVTVHQDQEQVADPGRRAGQEAVGLVAGVGRGRERGPAAERRAEDAGDRIGGPDGDGAGADGGDGGEEEEDEDEEEQERRRGRAATGHLVRRAMEKRRDYRSDRGRRRDCKRSAGDNRNVRLAKSISFAGQGQLPYDGLPAEWCRIFNFFVSFCLIADYFLLC